MHKTQNILDRTIQQNINQQEKKTQEIAPNQESNTQENEILQNRTIQSQRFNTNPYALVFLTRKS